MNCWQGGGSTDIASYSRELERQHPVRHELRLDFGDCVLAVLSNSEALLAQLRGYFGDLVLPAGPHAQGGTELHIRAFEAPPPSSGLPFRDWPREAGKVGLKEQFFDLHDGRVVFKVRSRMQFLIGRTERVAVGPCLAHGNQVINFINSQWISLRLREGWSLCHASGIAHPNPPGGRGIGIAARGGAGKSTLALHLLSSGLSFVSNDRLLIKDTPHGAEMAGIPKLPRVNPGTLLHNPDLQGILPADRQRELAHLPREQLWRLEEKYDVPVDRVYGKGRTLYRASLAGLLILNWSWANRAAPTRFAPVDLAARRDLLALVMKSPGVFHLDAQAQSAQPPAQPEPAEYLQALSHTRVWEATGCPEFELGVRFCRGLLEV